MRQENDLEYAGFFIRAIAFLVDFLLLSFLFIPYLTKGFALIFGDVNRDSYFNFEQIILIWNFYGWHWSSFLALLANFISYRLLPFIVVIFFWWFFSATPGKLIFSTKIVDSRNGKKPTKLQFVIRYFSYFISALPFLLGFLWIVVDRRNQGWHDKIARTVVVRKTRNTVFFDYKQDESQ